MLRTLVLALAIGAPTLAAAEEFPRSAQDAVVLGDDGTPLGRVRSVERDHQGRIVAMEIPGLEPGDAPNARQMVVADVDERTLVRLDTTQRPRANQGGSALLRTR